jgi:signal transduction histidine kinase
VESALFRARGEATVPPLACRQPPLCAHPTRRLIWRGWTSALGLTYIRLQADAPRAVRRYGLFVRAVGLDRVTRGSFEDTTLAALFVVVAQLDVWVLGTVQGPRLTNAVILAFVGSPLAWRRRYPAGALVVTSVAIAAQVLLVPGKPPSGFLYAGPILIGAYSVGAYAAWSWRTLASLGAIVVSFDVIYASAQGVTGSFSAITGDVMWLVLPLSMWLLGHHVRGRRLSAGAAAEQMRVERDREQRRLEALERERARMARELHDILAHSVSVMGVQAGAAEEVLGRDPERARPALRSIQEISRDSIGELRRLLGMLRSDELEPSTAPQPRLEQLGALIGRMRQAGLPVALQITGTRRVLSAGLELTAYRVVQEALTNALKHARPSHVDVGLAYSPDYLEISIDNDGPIVAGNGSGQGLIGMNERVSLYGGTLVAAPNPQGGYHVAARLPLESTRT